MNSITIQFDGKEFIIKQSFRALMLFEEMTGKNVSNINESLNDILTLLYCVLKAANKEKFSYTFDQFVDLIDENPEIPMKFNEYLMQNQNANSSEKKSQIQD